MRKSYPLCTIILLCCLNTGFAQGRTYTVDADFDEGVLVNVHHDIPDQLQLSYPAGSYPFLWVAASLRDTIVKIDVATGEVVGEYWSSPAGTAGNPSRTTVDRFGNLWSGNRDPNPDDRGSVVKIGAIVGGTRVDATGNPDPDGEYLDGPYELNNCIDRDGDGLIRTSGRLGQILDWPSGTDGSGSLCTVDDPDARVADALDECILVLQRVDTRHPRHLSVDSTDDIWIGGQWFADLNPGRFNRLDPDSGCIEFSRLLRCDIGGSSEPVGGYGGLTDCNDVLWTIDRTASPFQVVRYDIASDTETCMNSRQSYGLAIDSGGMIWHSQHTPGHLLQLDPVPPTPIPLGDWPSGGDDGDRGLAVSLDDDNIWIANSGPRSSDGRDVSRFANDGTLLEVVNLPGALTPTGVAVDGFGKIWVTLRDTDNVMRIDPALEADVRAGLDASTVGLTVDLNCRTARPALCAAEPGSRCCTSDAGPYNYSDMTGMVALANPPFGTWSVIDEAGCDGARWGTIRWTSDEPGLTSIAVDVRAADTFAGLGGEPWTRVGNGVPFGPLLGRYLETLVTFRVEVGGCDPSEPTPILYDLTVEGAIDPCGADDCFAVNELRVECPKGGDDDCIRSITLAEVDDLSSFATFTPADFDGSNTTFAVGDSEGTFHVSCSRCLRVGDTDGGLVIIALDVGEKMERKCDGALAPLTAARPLSPLSPLSPESPLSPLSPMSPESPESPTSTSSNAICERPSMLKLKGSFDFPGAPIYLPTDPVTLTIDGVVIVDALFGEFTRKGNEYELEFGPRGKDKLTLDFDKCTFELEVEDTPLPPLESGLPVEIVLTIDGDSGTDIVFLDGDLDYDRDPAIECCPKAKTTKAPPAPG